MEAIGSCSDRPPKSFSIPIDLREEHMRLPAFFYGKKKSQIKNDVELTDPMGNCVTIGVMTGSSGVVLWDAVPKLVKFYGLKKNHDMVFVYEGENRFRIEIFDENKKHFPYPILVKQEYEEPPKEIVDLSSDTEDEVEKAGGVANRVHAVAQVDNQIDYSFTKVVTTSVAKGSQTLPLPRSVIREYLSHNNWENLVLKKEGAKKPYRCKLFGRKRLRFTDYHLGGDGLYHFISDNKLAEGDRLHFTANEINNIVQVKIVRRNGNGN
ncbi:uncharacterized protein LOC130723915 [Lotus japonicus]|uniref:uncharacterized protein LOC130723915 n=1 Tax=Lotus japonicus TaxID=34305 RepID=UPI00258C0BD8|nr:uncharacterized protein LOC130723915 [Lotus japonicus]XP_057431048.1 uncharacterized protein LOC130723915 [Lotus japonicus]